MRRGTCVRDTKLNQSFSLSREREREQLGEISRDGIMIIKLLTRIETFKFELDRSTN